MKQYGTEFFGTFWLVLVGFGEDQDKNVALRIRIDRVSDN